jgi:prolipoprotein diacylglyceryltransferase
VRHRRDLAGHRPGQPPVPAQRGRPGVILDVAAWAVPFGLIGVAIHALLIDARDDFGQQYRLWPAVTAGVAAIGVPGAVAPAIMFGLAVAGLGNWRTQQFYGSPSAWWWALQISPTHRVPEDENYGTFQPTFAYQSLWDVAAGLAVIWAARRLALSGARTFMLCAACYALGSRWVEWLRIGPMSHVFGIASGQLINTGVFALALAGLYLTRPRGAPPARTYPKTNLVDDSSGDVMSM